MKPEDLKNLEYYIANDKFVVYVNGKEVWSQTRQEFEDDRLKACTIELQLEKKGNIFFAIYPRFKRLDAIVLGPLELKDNTLALSKDKVDWLVGITKIKQQLFSLKDKKVLDKTINDHKRWIIDLESKIKEMQKKIKEYEDIINLLEKLGRDRKWK